MGTLLMAETLDEEDAVNSGNALSGRLDGITLMRAQGYAMNLTPEHAIIAYGSNSVISRAIFRGSVVGSASSASALSETSALSENSKRLGFKASRISEKMRHELIVKRYLAHQVRELRVHACRERAARGPGAQKRRVECASCECEQREEPHTLPSPAPSPPFPPQVREAAMRRVLRIETALHMQTYGGAPGQHWETAPLPGDLGMGLNYSTHPGARYITRLAVVTDMLEEDNSATSIIASVVLDAASATPNSSALGETARGGATARSGVQGTGRSGRPGVGSARLSSGRAHSNRHSSGHGHSSRREGRSATRESARDGRGASRESARGSSGRHSASRR